MNKTVTVNIGGIVFHIEEQAYTELKHYLDSVRKALRGQEGTDEILQDIEARIAEMFNEMIRHERQVLTSSDVHTVSAVMGTPEAVAGTDLDEQPGLESETSEGNQKGLKRLFRDPDDKVIGGVCSGFGYYVGIDPLWFRLLFACTFLFWGSGLLLYILLILIIPKARTTTEKLEMKGKPVNVSTIRSLVEEEVNGIRDGLNAQREQKLGGKVASFFEMVGQILLAAAKFVFKLIAVFTVFILSIVCFALFIALLAIAGIVPGASIPVVLSELVLSSAQLGVIVLSLSLLLGIPLLLLLYTVIRRLFKLKPMPKSVKLTALSVWIFGAILSGFTAADIAAKFSKEANVFRSVPLVQPAGDTLTLAALPLNTVQGTYTVISDEAFEVHEDADSVLFGAVKLDIRKAQGSAFELTRTLTAHGTDSKEASRNAAAIRHEIEQNGNLLSMGSVFGLPQQSKYRFQSVEMILYVPVGKSIFLDESSGNLIHDIQNISNTLDEDMPGRVWTMTENGLACIGCNLPQSTDDEDIQIRINGKTIDPDSVSDINLDTMDLNGVSIDINENGIRVEAGGEKKK